MQKYYNIFDIFAEIKITKYQKQNQYEKTF
jgi:hypothetical protein